MMRKRFLIGLAAALAITLLYGCGGGGDSEANDPAPQSTTQIFSSPRADGDIVFTPPSAYAVSSALTTGNVFAGVDPATGDEFRGFLDFPLGGPDGVPVDATIESAILEIQINSVAVPSPGATVPMIIDLVNFQPPTLVADDFDRTAQPPLLSLAPVTLFSFDAGDMVALDVTPLMQEAQRLGLPDLQLRLLLDFAVDSGLIEIDDDDDATAPLLTVTYF
jgi:hypothetical protein